MIAPRIVFVGFALLFFGPATQAQDSLEIKLKACPVETAPNDPSIVIKKVVQAGQACTVSPLEVEITDTRFGFSIMAKTIANLSSKPWPVEPSAHDVFTTHKPCRRLFPERGLMLEWLVPRSKICDGREAAWYYRVYTKDKVCIMPGERCVPIGEPDTLPKLRFDESVWIAYKR